MKKQSTVILNTVTEQWWQEKHIFVKAISYQYYHTEIIMGQRTET